MEFVFLSDLEKFLRSEFSGYPATATLVPERCPNGMAGDFALNCFRIGRFCGNPVRAAEAVAGFLKGHPDIEAVEVIKAFVNVTVKAAALHRDLPDYRADEPRTGCWIPRGSRRRSGGGF